MAFISEIAFRGGNNANDETVEVTLGPNDDPADFVLSAYDQDGNLHTTSGLSGGEVNFASLTGVPHPDNPDFTIYTVNLGIRNADSDSNEATGVALTNVTDGEVVNFYSAARRSEIDPQEGAANLSGVTSDNLLEHTDISSDESYQWDIEGNLTQGAQTDADSVICFTADTMILTDKGEVPCAQLNRGDLVWTADAGYHPIRWVGACELSEVELNKHPNLRPVRIGKDAFVDGIPSADLVVSPQHRMLVQSAVADRMFDSPEVLIAACKLCAFQKIRIDKDVKAVTYVHLLLDEHHILSANGALTESLLLAEQSSEHLSAAHFTDAEGRAIPQEMSHLSDRPARPIAKRSKAKMLVRRLRRNGHAIQTVAWDLRTAA